jgi:S-disulfanyl-L-cysteine oxidoreductase SoxD
MSTLKHLSSASFPGRSAARSGALQTRDRYVLRVCDDPGSAVHRSAALRAAPHPGNARRSVIAAFAAALLSLLTLASSAAFAANTPNLGKPVTETDIKAWDVTILPDGTGLPPGSGTAAQGAKLFDDKGCSLCHGKNAKGGISNELIGNPSLVEGGIDANKTIANFWGQATTLFDYIRRAMPWPTPHTLSDDEVYALCAYLLAGNNIIPADEPMNAQTLPKVKMPNRDNFIIKFPGRI